MFKRTYQLDRAQFETWLNVKRPLAKHYHDAIIHENGFQQIKHVGDALPGDLLAVIYPPGEENTGHVMLVADKPRKRDATPPLIADTVQWEVAVIDVSRSGHGPNDTRARAAASPEDANSDSGKHSREGLGRGTLRIYTDENGAVAGYSWSTTKGSKFVEQSYHHLVIGRVKPEFIETLKNSSK